MLSHNLLNRFNYILNFSATKHVVIHIKYTSNNGKFSNLLSLLNGYKFVQHVICKKILVKKFFSTVNTVRCTHQDSSHTVTLQPSFWFQFFAINHNLSSMKYN